MTIRKFEDHQHANARIACDTNGMALISYNTIVAELSPEGWLRINGLYSMTTRKHLGWFMRELGFTYQLARQLYEDRELFNVNTGEVIPV